MNSRRFIARLAFERFRSDCRQIVSTSPNGRVSEMGSLADRMGIASDYSAGDWPQNTASVWSALIGLQPPASLQPCFDMPSENALRLLWNRRCRAEPARAFRKPADADQLAPIGPRNPSRAATLPSGRSFTRPGASFDGTP